MRLSFKASSPGCFATLSLCVLALPGNVSTAWGAVPTAPAFEASVRASSSPALTGWLAAQAAASARARTINIASLRAAVVTAYAQKPLATETVDALVYVYLSDVARALQPELETLQAGRDTIARLASDAARMQTEELSLEYLIGAFQKLQAESTATGGASAGAKAGAAGAGGSAIAGGSAGAGAAGAGGAAAAGGSAGAGASRSTDCVDAHSTATPLDRLAGRVRGLSGDLQDLNQQFSTELQRIVTAQTAANTQRSNIYARNAALIDSIIANLRQ